MKRSLLLFSLFILCIEFAHAQMGISFGYETLNSTKFNKLFQRDYTTNPYPLDGRQISVWANLLSIKNKKISFIPEFSYGKYEFNIQYREIFSTQIQNMEHQIFSLKINTQFHILDIIIGNNNSSEARRFIKKSLFIETSPFIAQRTIKEYYIAPFEERIFQDKNLIYGGSLGLGLDLTLFDLVTLTPLVRYTYSPDYSRKGKSIYRITSDLKQFYVGCRIGIEIN